MSLATFVHISDLHLGDLDRETLDAVAPDFWAKAPWFRGILGHSYKALCRLDAAYHKLKREENAILLVTGDLTTVGKPSQFEMADRFLGASLKPPEGHLVGLGDPGWQSRAVPGNHDHWPGRGVIFGSPTAALSRYFPERSFSREPLIRLGPSHTLRLIGLDSDTDVHPFGPSRFLARGGFARELDRLAAKIPAVPNANEIRVLLIHHSFHYDRIVLGIESVSKKALREFLGDHDVAVVLTGHVHRPLLRCFDRDRNRDAAPTLEARCGTTTQRSRVPYRWRTLLGGRSDGRLPPNSLLVHRIQEHAGALYWTAEVHQETPRLGFAPCGGSRSRLRVRVWPR